MKKTLAAAFALTTVSLAWAAELAPGAPEVYVVQKGDTLWSISGRYLQDNWKWPEVWQVNPHVDNPHLIFPGDVLSLVYVEGQPRVARVAGPGTERTVTTLGADTSGDKTVMVETKMPDGTTKLSPKVRVLTEGEAIATLPRDIIGPFLIDAKVVDKSALDEAAYVVASEGEHLINGAGDRIYVRGADANQRSYSIFRPGKAYIDPDSEEVLGYEALQVGNGLLVREGDPATLDLKSTTSEIRKGDRALPVDDSHLNPVFLPQPAPENSKARIISVYGGVSQIGQYNVVVLSRGEVDGIRSGHTFTVWTDGATVEDKIGGAAAAGTEEKKGLWASIKGLFTSEEGDGDDVKLPNENAGTVMVFRTFDRVSLALVMKATRPLHVGDVVSTPL